MDKKLKQALKDAYRAPAPMGKAAFLKCCRRRELGRWELIAVQAGYIRWWVWGVSLALFGLILRLASWPARGELWSASAFTPFLAMLVVAENGRSRLYRMEELELACRVPHHSVLLARMAVLGLFHMALLAALMPPLALWGAVGAARAGVYLLTPYLLTAALGMELTRCVRGRECLLACGGAAALVSALGVMLAKQRPALYQRESLPLWGAALAAAAAVTGVEILLNFKERAELQWN